MQCPLQSCCWRWQLILLMLATCSIIVVAYQPTLPSTRTRHRKTTHPNPPVVLIYMTKVDGDSSTAKKSKSVSSRKSLFAQPAFAQQQSSRTEPSRRSSDETPSSPSRPSRPQRSFQSDSTIMTLHQERLQTAGRVGTKRYVSPCKLFVGNLSFDTTEADLQAWLQRYLGDHLPPSLWLHHINIVRDWKTSKSKGYAFVDFTEPHFATMCILKCNNKELMSRQLVVKQGVKQPKANQLFVAKTKKAPLTDEEAAIQAGLAEAEAFESLDPEQVAMLRRLDPDLLPDYLQTDSVAVTSMSRQQQVGVMAALDDEDDDDYDGDELDVEDEDDDDFEYDGDYDEVDELVDGENDETSVPMNRADRRKAARQNKKKKKPAKGFGK